MSTSDRLVPLLARQRGLNAPPGSEYGYNNGGYLLLGEIVHRVSGLSLRRFTETALFGPLGMRHTHFHDDPSMIVPGLATGYTGHGDGLRLARASSGVVGNGGLFTTAGDLLRWADNLRSGRVGGADLVAAMQQPNERLWTRAEGSAGRGAAGHRVHLNASAAQGLHCVRAAASRPR